MFKTIKNFLYGMFGDDGKISSKRVTGFICLLAIIEMVQANLWVGKTVDSELLYVLAGLIATCFGMNTLIDVKSITTKSNIASDIVKEQPSGDTADDAKDVLNSDKP